MTPSVPSARLAGFYFAYFALIGALMPYWNLYLEQRGFSKHDIGWLAFIAVFSRIIAPSVWGWLADRSGKRMRWVRLGVLAECVVWPAILLLPLDFFSLALILFIFSFFQNAILAQFEAVTLFWLGDARARYGQIRLWGSLGFIAAVFGLGAVFAWLPVQTLPLWMMALALPTLLLAYRIAEPPLLPTALATSPTASQPARSIGHTLRQPQVLLFFALEFLLLLSHAPFYSFYSNYLAAYGYATLTIGTLWSVGVLAEVLMFTQSQRLLARFTERNLLLACLGLTAVRWAVVAAYPIVLWLQLLAQCVHAFSFALFQSLAMRFIFTAFLPQQQGRGQGMFSMMWGVGVALGSLLAGQYWDAVGGQAVFALAALVCALATLLAYFCWTIVPKRA